MSMIVLAIDPGPKESAFIVCSQELNGDWELCERGKTPNESLLVRIEAEHERPAWRIAAVVIEQVSCMGMPVGAEVFETVFWSGRFVQAWNKQFFRVKRHQVKMHLCGNMRAKDANIRQALIDKIGKQGTKKQQGPTYGLSGDVWSALAVGVTFIESRPDLDAPQLVGCEEDGND